MASNPVSSERIVGFEKDTVVRLRKILLDRGITPKRNLKSLREQCRLFNENLNSSETEELITSPVIADTNIQSEDTDLVTIQNVEKEITPVDRNESIRYVERKLINLSNWKITFDGTTDVHAFFDRIAELQYARGVDNVDVAKGFIDLITGTSLMFYRKIFRKDITWPEIKSAFIKRFENPAFQMTEKSRLFNLFQGKNEMAADFILEALSINAKLNIPLAEQELLSLITKGLLPDYAQLKIGKDVNNVAQLQKLCDEMDRIKFNNTSVKTQKDSSHGNSNVGADEDQIKIRSKIYQYKQLHNVSVGQYINLISSLNNKLKTPLSEKEIVFIVKNGLLNRYNKLFMYELPNTCAELERKCSESDNIQNTIQFTNSKYKSFNKNNIRSTQVSALSPRQVIGNITKSKICYKCEKAGHFARNCNQNNNILVPRRSPRWKKQEYKNNNPIPDLSKPPPFYFNKNQKNM